VRHDPQHSAVAPRPRRLMRQDRAMQRTTPRTGGLPQRQRTPFPALMMLALTAATLAACGSAPARPAALTATRQVHVSPVGADGRPVSGYRITKTASHAGCEPGSEAIGQAYRCVAGNFLYDPCWAERADTPTVLCLPFPWSVTVIRLDVDAPLTAIPAATGTSEPWGLELAGGQRCVLLQGAHSLFGDRVIDYYCNSRLSLLRGLTRGAAVWSAASVTDIAGKQARGPAEKIKIAWYGSPDSYR
jgi:hypothetical protein